MPDAEEWLRNNIIVAVGSMLINAPGKVLKGTVNTAHSIATKSIRGVGGLVNTTGVSGPGGFLHDFFLLKASRGLAGWLAPNLPT